MTRLLAALVVLVVLVILTHHAVLLPLAVLATAGAVGWYWRDCLRWPPVWTPLDDWSGTFA